MRHSAARRVLSTLAAVSIMTSLMVFGTAAASAACPTDINYSLTSSAVRVPFKGVPVFKNGPGGSVDATRSYSGTATYQVTVGAESEVGAIFAKAKVSISASLTKSNTTGTTITYHHKISAGKFGHLQYVSWGKKVNWKKYRDTPQCTTELIGSGSINFPATEEGWYFWQTSQ
jgi:hypothetical protein